MGGPGGSWGSFLALLGPRRAPRGARSAPGRRQGGQKRPRRAPRRPQGPPKGPPKSPQKRSKIQAPRSIVKHGVSSWKIAFSLGLAAFIGQSSRPNRCFFASHALKHRVLRGRRGPKRRKTRKYAFSQGGPPCGTSRVFFWGSGPDKIAKNSVFKREVLQKCEN